MDAVVAMRFEIAYRDCSLFVKRSVSLFVAANRPRPRSTRYLLFSLPCGSATPPLKNNLAILAHLNNIRCHQGFSQLSELGILASLTWPSWHPYLGEVLIREKCPVTRHL
jgi:hypothetical protein